MSPEVVEIAEKQAKKEPITSRPADLLKPEWDGAAGRGRKPLKGCNGTDEDVLTYAMFPQVAPEVLRRPAGRTQERRQAIRARPAPPVVRHPPDAVRAHIKYQVTDQTARLTT